MLLLTALSAFFSGTETAVTSMSRERLRALVDEHPAKARALRALLDEPTVFITTLLIGNNFVNIMASSVATVLTLQLLRLLLGVEEVNAGQAILTATVFLTMYMLIFGEITPKTLAKNHAERVTLAVVNLIYWLTRLLRPLVAAFHWVSRGIFRVLPGEYGGMEPLQVSEDQIKYLIEVSEQRGLIDEEEGDMIRRIFAYDDLVVEQIMVPRTEVVSIDVKTPLEEVRALVAENGHSRYPVYEKDPDDVIGVLHAKDLLRCGRDTTLRDLLRPAHFVPETKPVNDLLRDFRQHKQHLAIAVDEYGGLVGIVTLEDVLEEIVGEIRDEYDKPEEPIQPIGEGQYLVEGDAEISLINEELELNLPTEEGVTISGLILHRLEDIPKVGESLTVDGTHITVEEASDKEILKVRLQVPSSAPEPEADPNPRR